MLARRFLWIVAGLIVLALICAFLYRLYGHKLVEWATVPTVAFEEAAAAGGPDYASADSWIARPDRGSNPALWLPTGMERGPAGEAAVFFIHPTSYLEKARWNAPVDDAESQQRARLFVRSQASAFNGAGEIWAPKYRQATFGAFLTTKTDAQKALDLAYRDVGRIRPLNSGRPADHPGRAQPGQPAPHPAAQGTGGGHSAHGADRGGLCSRLADLDQRRSRAARSARLP